MHRHQTMIVRSLLVATAVSFALAAPARAASSKDEDAIKARVADFIALFNKGDVKGMAAFWTDDAMLVNPVGMSGKGTAEIEKIFTGDTAFFKDSKMEMKVVEFRPVGKDAAWVELEHSVTGAHTPDGKAMPPMTFHVPTLMVKKGKTWMIAEARPYAYLPPPPGAKPAAAAAPAAPAAPAKK
jgi:uncharacterized protein (TIGR02246 family)